MSKKIASLITIVLSLTLVGILVFIVYGLFKTDFNGFGLEHKGKEILTNTANVVLTEGDVITLKYYYGDMGDIKVYMKPVEVAEDFEFTIDGEVKSWNTDIVKSNTVDHSKLLEFYIDNVANTVTVKGSVKQGLKAVFEAEKVSWAGFLPVEDMFYIMIESGDTTITLSSRIYAQTEKISIGNEDITF
ncbi:MAG: hypothetical protein IJ514_03075 [Clostridia bacterium]|nr:hypothetical protein [Clostridia bacterium]